MRDYESVSQPIQWSTIFKKLPHSTNAIEKL
jgi:hypothetical protein